MALGLAAASPAGAPAGARLRNTTVIVAAAFAAALPFRTAAAVETAQLGAASAGFSKWQHAPDGSRYRWAGGTSAFYVPSTARWVRVPLQHGSEGPGTIEVRILLDGREANRVLLHAGEGWQDLRLLLPAERPDRKFLRIDLEAGVPGASAPLAIDATDTGGVLKVGRPLLEEQ